MNRICLLAFALTLAGCKSATLSSDAGLTNDASAASTVQGERSEAQSFVRGGPGETWSFSYPDDRRGMRFVSCESGDLEAGHYMVTCDDQWSKARLPMRRIFKVDASGAILEQTDINTATRKRVTTTF